MKKTYTVFLCLFFCANAYAQTTWEKLFSNLSDDVFRCVIEVPAGGYAAAGSVANFSAKDSDAFVVRLTTNGDTLWTFRYNGPMSRSDLFYKIINTSDGGFALCGYTTSVNGLSDDILVMKLNSSGIQQWVKFFGGSGKDRAQDILETSDGKFVVVGYTTTPPAQYYDAFLMRLDVDGDSLWEKRYGGSLYDDANSLRELSDGGFILGGQSNNGNFGLDQYLVRTNSTGDTLWTKRFGFPSNSTENIDCIRLLPDGFILAGGTDDTTIYKGNNGYLVKTDTSGNVLWSKVLGNDEQNDFHSVESVSSGGFIICGTTTVNTPEDPDPSIWVVRTDNSGNTVWTKVFGGFRHDHGYSAVPTSDGGFLIGGFSSSFGFDHFDDAYVIKTNGSGIVSNPLNYVSIYKVVSPTCASATSQLRLDLRNFGHVSVSNISITVNISGGVTQTLNGSFSDTLDLNGGQAFVTFNPTFNTLGAGPITFHCVANVDNDVFPENNFLDTTISLPPCVGIDELDADPGYEIYPNPATDNLTIDFSQNYPEAKIELINLSGAIVQTLILKNTFGLRRTIDVSSHAGGLYLVKVVTDDGFSARKIFLEK